MGINSTASGVSSISIGTGNMVTGDNSGAIGDPSTVSGAASYSIGNNNNVATDKTFVLGNNVTTTVANSVILGDSSAATAAVATSSTTINGTTYNFAGTSPVGVISVGSAGSERQIQNVAAGQLSSTSTDAINGSQLYATNQAVDLLGTNVTNLGNSTATNLGGGSTYNSTTGTVNAPNYTVQGSTYNNVGAAVDALDNSVSTIYNRVDKLGSKINQTGALSAALSGLKPLQYDPMERTQIMAAYGNYHSGSAMALGLAYYINESTMVHAGAAFGHSDQMYNVGATWKIGSSDAEKALPEKYRSGPISSIYVMQDELRVKDQQIAQLQEQNKGTQEQNKRMQEQIDYLMSKVK